MIPSAEAASFGVSVWKNDGTCRCDTDVSMGMTLCYVSFRNVLHTFGLCLFARIAANSYQFVMACAVIFLLVLDSTTAAILTRFERNSVIW